MTNITVLAKGGYTHYRYYNEFKDESEKYGTRVLKFIDDIPLLENEAIGLRRVYRQKDQLRVVRGIALGESDWGLFGCELMQYMVIEEMIPLPDEIIPYARDADDKHLGFRSDVRKYYVRKLEELNESVRQVTERLESL